MKITIYIQTDNKHFIQDLDWPEHHPLGGSETAALRLAKALLALGEEVQLITDPEALSQHNCDVFISLRQWRIFAAGIYPGKRNYLWCHDDVDRPMVKPLEDPLIAKPIYQRLDGVLILSHYQAERWISVLHLPLNKIIKISNGIPLKLFKPQPEKLVGRKPWAFYSSTPFRGLEILLMAWPHILNAVPEAQLHVFSSMQIYYPDQHQDEYSHLYAKAKSLPNVHYYGSVGQAELRGVAQKCRVLAYPCIFPETSCITAMEAMAAGCVVVSTALGALPETAWQNPLVPLADGWGQQWILEVIKALQDNRYYEQMALQNIAAAKYYDWNRVAQNLLNELG